MLGVCQNDVSLGNLCWVPITGAKHRGSASAGGEHSLSLGAELCGVSLGTELCGPTSLVLVSVHALDQRAKKDVVHGSEEDHKVEHPVIPSMMTPGHLGANVSAINHADITVDHSQQTSGSRVCTGWT